MDGLWTIILVLVASALLIFLIATYDEACARDFSIMCQVLKASPHGLTAKQLEDECQRWLGRKLMWTSLWKYLIDLERQKLIAGRWEHGPYPRRRIYYWKG